MALIATRLSNFVSRQSLLQGRCLLSIPQERRRHKTVSRRRLPTRAKTFQQRLDELSAKDLHRYSSINIGFPLVNQKETDKHQKFKARGKLEFAARHRKLKLDLKVVQKRWLKEQGPHHIRNITEHYGLYDHLFGSAFFYNTTPLSVCYDYDEAFVTPVCHGNKIFPSEAAVAPFVSYESDGDTLWTLMMTSPDGHLQHNDKECLHWMVTNIHGCDVHGGETLCEYLQPFPLRGAGYIRYAFILFRQQKHMDLSSYMISNSKSLSERTFSTADFYRKHREDITPASICFFQSRWDASVTSVFHDVLKMKEPSYEFIPAPNYHPEEERHYAQPDSIEWYLDCYFGEDDTLEDWYTEELEAHVDPTTHPVESSRSPSIVSTAQAVPSWMKLRLKDLRLPEHQWKDLKPSS